MKKIGKKQSLCWKKIYWIQNKGIVIEFCFIFISLLQLTNIPIYFRSYTDDLRLETYIKIAKLYLKSDNPLQAETYIRRAPLLEVWLFK